MQERSSKNKVFATVCQKCDAPPVVVPLASLEYPKGIIFVPDIVYCIECGAQLTAQIRGLTKDEIEKRDNDKDPHKS